MCLQVVNPVHEIIKKKKKKHKLIDEAIYGTETDNILGQRLPDTKTDTKETK